ncbi:YlxR family protein [Ilumatobacter coccineus]|uniref:YlxR domain-containing protein n=1 Tax=Ilumatobacter coccineus (strain NBRC 103263 / KCTC 29153 / YM16-304) TaxID=1313172 RepID=A0A6C7E641_ILUCY|nr:hypothetical protein YM304_15890 [Ilumatobacter coccineus YM16-304]
MPIRSCIGCRQRRPSHELVRVTRSFDDDGNSIITVDGASNGRGAWLCRSSDGLVEHGCRDMAITRKQFARAWRSTLTSDDVQRIRQATGNSPCDVRE